VRTHERDAAEAVAARDQNSLYLTSRFFADERRYHSFCAYYALMRVVDDRIDGLLDRRSLSERDRRYEHEVVGAWEEAIRCAYESRSPSRRVMDQCGHPEAPALLESLAAALASYPVFPSLWSNFFRSMHWDLDHDRFDTWQDFLDYAEGASVSPTTIYLILLASRPDRSTAGLSFPAGFDLETCGRKLGTFAYLGHIVRDLAADLGTGTRGLLYFSYEDLKKHDLTEAQLFADLAHGEASPATRSLVAELLRRARNYLDEGRNAMAPLRGTIEYDCAFILELIVTLYQSVIERIESCGCDPLTDEHLDVTVERKGVRREDA
jgi:phytoene synthase